MSIEVNKNPIDWVKDENITQLLKRMNYTFPLVVVKIDSQVIPKAKYSETIVPDNSIIEVIHLISGG